MNPIDQKKEEVRQNLLRYNRALDTIRHRRNLSDDEKRLAIHEGRQSLQNRHRELIGELRETKAAYRQELESAIFKPDRPSNYSTLAQRPLELMSIRDAAARARAAENADELSEMLETSLYIGDTAAAHACFVEANRRAPQDTTLAEVAGVGTASGPHVAIMRRYLETDQRRADAYSEWSIMGDDEAVADDVLEGLQMAFPAEPVELRGWRPPPSEETGNPFEAPPEEPVISHA